MHKLQTFCCSSSCDKKQASWGLHTASMTLAPKFEQAGMREEWMPFLIRGIERCKEEELAIQAEMELFIGILYRLVGKWRESRAYLESSVQHFEAAKNEDGQAPSSRCRPSCRAAGQ